VTCIADAISVGIELIGVGHIRAVVFRVGNAVAIAVIGTGIAYAVANGIELIGVIYAGAVVFVVGDAVPVHIIITGITYAVAIEVCLIGVRYIGAVVLFIDDAVAIAIVDAEALLSIPNDFNGFVDICAYDFQCTDCWHDLSAGGFILREVEIRLRVGGLFFRAAEGGQSVGIELGLEFVERFGHTFVVDTRGKCGGG